MMELPAFFQPTPLCEGPASREPEVLVAYYEKVTLNLAIHSRMLRLHRPWLSKGYQDERYGIDRNETDQSDSRIRRNSASEPQGHRYG